MSIQAKQRTKQAESQLEISIWGADDFLDTIDARKAFKYNARKPSTKSKAYQGMLDTLEHAPGQFLTRNSGVVIVNGEYLVNGGHTWLALRDARQRGYSLTDVEIKVTERSDLSEPEIIAMARALNTQVTPPLRGMMDLENTFDTLQQQIPVKYRSLYEFRTGTNPQATYKVDFLIALLHAVSTQPSPERAYASKGVLVRLYTRDKYVNELPQLETLIDLWSQIASDLAKEPSVSQWVGVGKSEWTLPNGTVAKCRVPEAYVWLPFAAFSKIRDEQGDWDTDPMRAWKLTKEAILKALRKVYNESGRVPTKLGKNSNAYLQVMMSFVSALRRSEK